MTDLGYFGGGCGVFGGMSSGLVIPDHNDFNFADGDFTIEAVFKLFHLRTTSQYFTIYSQRISNTVDNAMSIYIRGGTPSRIYLSVSWTGIKDNAKYWNYPLEEGKYYHIAVCRVDNLLYCFIDGELLGTYSAGTNAIFDSSSPVTIGKMGATTYPFLGTIEEVQVIKGVGKWTTNFTPPSTRYDGSENPVLLVHFTGTSGSTNIVDSSISGHSITVENVGIVNQLIPFGASVGFFNYDTYLRVPFNINFAPKNLNFTIHTWFNLFSLPESGGRSYIFHQHGGTTSYVHQQLFITFDGTNYQLTWIHGTASSTRTTISGNININPGEWHHVAVVRSGSYMYLFFDGVQLSRFSRGTTALYHRDGDEFRIGNGFVGVMKEFRYVLGTGLWTSSFTPPVATYP
jgi:hypothetical protein